MFVRDALLPLYLAFTVIVLPSTHIAGEGCATRGRLGSRHRDFTVPP
jgi:hypothetical protein